MAIFLTGDTHGDFRRFENTIFYEQVGLTKRDCVIICGDMGGIWDGSPEEQQQLDWLEQRPYTTLFVSGNHENYDLLAEYPVEEWNGGQIQRVRPSVIHLVDYHLRECLKREIKMRVCKNCGRLFAVTGHGGIEYCDRPFDEKGRTCKEIGAFRVWEKSKSEDEVFKVYRREYKKRFAWIKAGRITKDEFYAWSEKAREKKTECEAGRITLEEFAQWLNQS